MDKIKSNPVNAASITSMMKKRQEAHEASQTARRNAGRIQ